MLTLSNVALRRGTKLVLQDVNFTLHVGEKAGLVGRNGAGKSSLFALIAQRLDADSGDVSMPATWQMAEVAQQIPDSELSATDFVLEGDTKRQSALQALASAEQQGDGVAIAHAHQALDEANAFDARSRAEALLMGLGFTSSQLSNVVNTFSGGWRMRLQLARALMCPADLLMLDEPTNHLDLDALVWLEAWLKRFAGTLVIISHDREFLDAITDVTLSLEDQRVVRYGGNYSAFEQMRAVRLEQQAAGFAKQSERIAQLQRFIDRFKAKASKAKQAQSRVKALARMERLAPVLTSREFSFEFKEPESLPNPMLAFDNVSCGYSAAHEVVRVDARSLLAGQRVGVLGANGQGKSTLVKTIANTLAPLAGRLVVGKGLAIGYFAQHEMDVLHADDTPLQHMIRLARDRGPQGREQELRNFLGQFRFGAEMVHQAIETLSGGERARLLLASLVWQRPNLLLLDEPTNHLDLETREALSMALNEFEGSVLLVSHDRALLREVCDEFWLVTGGELKVFDGDLDDYQRWLLDQSKQRAKPSNIATSTSNRAAAPKPVDRKVAALARQQRADQLKPLQRELNSLDNRLGVLFDQREGLEAQLSAEGISSAEIAEAGKQLKAANGEIERLEERWYQLSEQIDLIKAAAEA